jgi:crossover junction endodeoxyribonuclease RuvC
MTTTVGIDLSLQSTGVCILDSAGYTTHRICPGARRSWERIDFILAELADLLRPLDSPRIHIEGYSFGSKGRAVFDIAECGGIVRWWLREHGYHFEDIPPSSLKKDATGKGNADKGLMLVTAVKRYGYEGSCHDEADAIHLAHYQRPA